ncbi:hypothetical protein FOA52_004015 [Chlamydomonas sp. UWO 241]|nr:hypothetical protein FOA52_004015 [Chlamydomonas sp. UWO 241]
MGYRQASCHLLPVLLVAVLLVNSLGSHPLVAAEEPQLASGTFPFADIQVAYKIYNHEDPKAPVVLFLHGQKFTSQNWVDLGTLKHVLAQGLRAVAIDLPGFGASGHLPFTDSNMRAELIKAALEFSGQGANVSEVGAVLVAPSMSGKWAIPFLDRYGLMLKGWVAIAPVGVMSWGGPWEYTHKQVGLLAVYGENDPMLAEADTLLKLFARSRKAVINGAGHACYIDGPEVFHTQLAKFLEANIRLPAPVLWRQDDR